MERLTKKTSKTVQDKYSLGSYLQYDFAKADDTNKLLNKLGEFEDLMEKYGLNIISDIEDVFLGFKHARQENQALKERWQKLKEWIKGQSNPIDNLVISDDETKYLYMSDILDEMQELEKE